MHTISRRVFLAFSGGGLAAFATPGTLAAGLGHARSAETYLPWAKLADGVHVTIDLKMGGNAMVIASGGDALLVDTKFPAFAAALAREGAAFGGPISRVINTHHHGDHTGGNGVLSSQAEIIAHANATDRIAAQLPHYLGIVKGGLRQIDVERPTADRVLEEAQAAIEASADWDAEGFTPDVAIEGWPHEIEVGEINLILHHFGAGHTDNDLVVHLPDLNIVHTGDLCFHGLHPYFDPGGGATCQGWSKAVGEVLKLCDADTTVVPGHGDLTDRAGLETQKRYLDDLWDLVAKEIGKGKTKDDITAMSWGFMDGLGFEQVRSRAIGAVYDELRREG